MSREVLRDLRFAVHLLIKDRWYSAVAVIALALGIGLNATVFTLCNAVLIRGLPFKDSGSLYMLGSPRQGERGNFSGVSLRDLDDWRTQTRTFTGLAAFSNSGANVSDDTSAPQQARSARITANTFALLDQPPLIGRAFATGDDKKGADPGVLLGYALWKTR